LKGYVMHRDFVAIVLDQMLRFYQRSGVGHVDFPMSHTKSKFST
jgi:hypothetical protein